MTYSLVAFDPDTGECGVAVQSHWFSVGSLVSWAEPGIGAVATQADVEISYGPRGLALMRSGRSAPEALAELIAADPKREGRQVAMVDVRGGVAVHTGSECMRFAGHTLGDHHSAQGNLMRSDRVWVAMSEAYRAPSGTLTERLLAALDAGEAAGGDLRGRQSAAIQVVPAEGESWQRVIEVRVEDHPDPVVELRRLVRRKAAHDFVEEGGDSVGVGDMDAAAAKYLEAWRLAPDAIAMRFWAALSLIHRGESERGEELLRGAIAEHEGWWDLLAMQTPADGPGVAEAQRLLRD